MLIKTEKMSYKYMSDTPLEVLALKDISLEIARGDFTGIIGSTGSGKSTLVQHFNGLLLPSSGSVFYDGYPTIGGGISLTELRRRVGLVFQYPEQHLFAETVFEDVSFGPRNMGIKDQEIKTRVEEALYLTGLDYEKYYDRSPFDLSGGEMRRVALAGVLAMRPEVLVLDEPTAGLDPFTRNEFLSLIRHLHHGQGKTIIMVSHNMDEVARLCSKVLVLHQGELVLQGSREEVFSNQPILKDYGLDLPPLAILMERLRNKGLNVPRGVFTMEEACREILSKI